jgi:hypothetical protein
MERLPQEKAKESILIEPEIAKFLDSRNINPDSLPLIEELSHIHKDTIIMCMHNFFAFNQGEKAMVSLQRSVEQAVSDEARRTYELFRDFTEQNDWYASRNLVALLEERES